MRYTYEAAIDFNETSRIDAHASVNIAALRGINKAVEDIEGSPAGKKAMDYWRSFRRCRRCMGDGQADGSAHIAVGDET